MFNVTKYISAATCLLDYISAPGLLCELVMVSAKEKELENVVLRELQFFRGDNTSSSNIYHEKMTKRHTKTHLARINHVLS